MTVKNIPEDTMSRFKSWAAYHGYTLNDAIIEIMREKGEQMEVRRDSKDSK